MRLYLTHVANDGRSVGTVAPSHLAVLVAGSQFRSPFMEIWTSPKDLASACSLTVNEVVFLYLWTWNILNQNDRLRSRVVYV